MLPFGQRYCGDIINMVYDKMHDLLDLAIWMQSDREGVSIQDIIERFQVSRRTAERMRDMIVEKFPQIVETLGERGIKKWHIPQGVLKDYVNFNLNEITALQTAYNLLNENQFFHQAETVFSILNKLKSLIRPDILNHLEPDAGALLEAEGYVFRPGPRIKINSEITKKLRTAILACRKIRIKYEGSSSPNWRIIYPYAFIYGNKHYLVAFSPKSRCTHYFNLNKISMVDITDEYFTRDPSFNVKQICENSFGIYSEPPFEVEWLFDDKAAPIAKEYIFHPRQQMTENADGTLTVKFKSGGSLEMAWHLYTWGNHVKVIKPENWEEMIKGKSRV